MLASWKKNYNKARQHIEKQKHYFSNKGPAGQSYGFSTSHACMWELDHKEGWVPHNWCFWTKVLEKTLESSLDSKEIKPVHPEGNQPWISFGRTDAETEAPILWPPDAKSRLIGKDLDGGKDRRQEEKGTTKDEMVGWHNRLNGPIVHIYSFLFFNSISLILICSATMKLVQWVGSKYMAHIRPIIIEWMNC